MDAVMSVVSSAQSRLQELLLELESKNGLEKKCYEKYLRMQYHLTKGVQNHFYRIAGHDQLKNKKSLRSFLVSFADEEAPHYSIAEKDLKNLGCETGEVPLDVDLWWAYFDRAIESRPFLRLGATCVLENITNTSADIVKNLMVKAEYLSPKNTCFLTIHMHSEELPHGDQIIEALNSANLSETELKDLRQGAENGAFMFMRMINWAFLA